MNEDYNNKGKCLSYWKTRYKVVKYLQDCVNRLAFIWKHNENKYCLKTKHSCSNGIIKTCETGCKWYISFAWSKTAHEAEKENGYQLWHLISMNFLKRPPQRELHNKTSTKNIKIYCIIKLYICFNLFETKTIMRTTQRDLKFPFLHHLHYFQWLFYNPSVLFTRKQWCKQIRKQHSQTSNSVLPLSLWVHTKNYNKTQREEKKINRSIFQ